MADMTHQGPPTTDPTRQDQRGHGPNTDLYQHSFSTDPSSPRVPSHTRASVAKRWGERSFDTGAVIRGEVVGVRR